MSRDNRKTSSLLEGGPYNREEQYPNPDQAREDQYRAVRTDALASLFGEDFAYGGVAPERKEEVSQAEERPVCPEAGVNEHFTRQDETPAKRQEMGGEYPLRQSVEQVVLQPEVRQAAVFREEPVSEPARQQVQNPNYGVREDKWVSAPYQERGYASDIQPESRYAVPQQETRQFEPERTPVEEIRTRIPAPNIAYNPKEQEVSIPKQEVRYAMRQPEVRQTGRNLEEPVMEQPQQYRQENPQGVYAQNRYNHVQEQSMGYMARQPQTGSRVPDNTGYVYASLEQPETQYQGYRKELICVHSPKGGVGKSTISKELAFMLSKVAPGKNSYRVLLVDADWELGDIATLLNVTPYPNVSDWVRVMLRDKKEYGRIPLYPAKDIKSKWVIDYGKVRPDLELHILAGCGNATDAAMIDEEIVTAMIESLRRCDYDYIIFDNANSILPRTVIPLMRCDKMVLVETLDTTTITETTILMDTLRSQQFNFEKLHMVLNQVPMDEKKLDISVADLERLLKMQMAAIIPEHGDVRLRNNAGESLLDGKENQATKELKKLANRIAPVYLEKKQGFLSKLFGKK